MLGKIQIWFEKNYYNHSSLYWALLSMFITGVIAFMFTYVSMR